MRSKTCCFTGHRKIASGQYDMIAERLEKTVENLIASGYCYFGAGGALGFDTMAAQTVLKLKKKHPHIRLILVLPCPSQAEFWQEADKEIYENIKSHADKVIYTSETYTRDCMFKRNRHLVDNSSVCICYLTEDKGGTAYTVNYAHKQQIQVINIA